MADDVTLDAATVGGGAVIRTDDDGSAHWQYIKVAYGADNTQTIVTASVGLPVKLLAGTAEVGKLAAGVAEIGNVKNSGTFATQATLQAGTAEIGKLAAGTAEIGNVKNAGTFVTQIDGAALTSLQLIDDPVFADNAGFTLSASKTMVSGGVYQNGTPGTLADNDVGAILLNSTAGQMVELMASSAVIGSVVNAGTFAVQSTLQAGTAEFGKLAAGVAEIGNVKNSGTFVTQNTAQASTNTQEMVGDVAHDAAAAGNPVLIAARATASVEGVTEVAGADATYLNADLSGTLITRKACAPAELVSFYVANTDGDEDAVTSLDDGGAAIYNFITSVTIHNAHASTNGYVTLLDGSAGSVFWVFPAPATGGTTHNFDPPLRQPTISTALFVDVSAAITTMHISINGYQGNG